MWGFSLLEQKNLVIHVNRLKPFYAIPQDTPISDTQSPEVVVKTEEGIGSYVSLGEEEGNADDTGEIKMWTRNIVSWPNIYEIYQIIMELMWHIDYGNCCAYGMHCFMLIIIVWWFVTCKGGNGVTVVIIISGYLLYITSNS